MASIINRSPFTVTVKGRKTLTRKFTYDKAKAAEAYAGALIGQGLTPHIEQAQTKFHVKVVNKGRKNQFETFDSLAEAEAFVSTLENDHRRGLFLDYTQAANTSTANLIEKYIEEECPKLKGGDNYIIILRAMLQDSTHELRKRIAERKAEIKEFGRALTPLGANRVPMTSLEWLHLPIAEVTPALIEDFICERLEDVMPATVDRQLDILSRIYKLARTTWRIHMAFSPMDGVRRPRFFNERDRRLKGDEEFRLIEAARKEDQLRSYESHVERLAADDVAAAKALSTHYARNEARKAAYAKARSQALGTGFTHVPRIEALVQFLLATGARRSEALGLFWDRLDWEEGTAYIPTSKNGRPRHLSIRRDILALLEQLPRDSDLVFDLGVKEVQLVWKRVCEAAGIDDLRVHDCRHEALSRAAESGKFKTVLDLQAYSGHRDVRSLTRYLHLRASSITKTLEEAEGDRLKHLPNKGRARLNMSQLHDLGGNTATMTTPLDALVATMSTPPAQSASDVQATSTEGPGNQGNVIAFQARGRQS